MKTSPKERIWEEKSHLCFQGTGPLSRVSETFPREELTGAGALGAEPDQAASTWSALTPSHSHPQLSPVGTKECAHFSDRNTEAQGDCDPACLRAPHTSPQPPPSFMPPREPCFPPTINNTDSLPLETCSLCPSGFPILLESQKEMFYFPTNSTTVTCLSATEHFLTNALSGYFLLVQTSRSDFRTPRGYSLRHSWATRPSPAPVGCTPTWHSEAASAVAMVTQGEVFVHLSRPDPEKAQENYHLKGNLYTALPTSGACRPGRCSAG